MDQSPTNFLPLAGPRSLGASGIEVAPLAWGMWRFKGTDLAHADRLVRTALENSFSLLDTADIYGLDSTEGFGAAEALLGRVLQADAGLRRRFVLASKGGIVPGTPYDSSPGYLVSACEASLRRLHTDTIDLYQIHRPDILAHPQEVAGALVKLRDSGKIRTAGVSNYSVAQTTALQAFLPFPLASHQPEFSALRIEPLVDGVLDQAMERKMAVLAWSPLGGGRLGGAGGDGSDGSDGRSRAVIAVLDKIALREATPRSAVALAWVLAHPSRPIAIIGTQTPQHMDEAVRALGVRLTREDWYEVLTASRQARLP
jgi:aryl-alcohol dehydrogenase-like predicted oxidoreductase